MKRERSKKKDFVKNAGNWKKQTVKTAVIVTLGLGIGWGYFSSQANQPVVSLAASNVNFGNTAQGNQKAYIGEVKAQEVASVHAGVTVLNMANPDWAAMKSSEGNVIVKKCKLELDNGIMVYEIEFFSLNYEYEYKINAITGSIISYEKERENNSLVIQALENSSNSAGSTGNTGNIGNTGTAANTENSTTAYIGMESAKSIAYSHAGVTKENIYPGWCELDWEDGRPVYEVEFQSVDGYDYEYEIHALTGEIISSKKEQSMHYTAIQANRNGQFGDTVIYIHQGEAEYAAVSHSGVTEYQLVGIQLDREDGIIVYEVKFISGIYEYDYNINAMTAEVTGYKKELCDPRSQNNQAGTAGTPINSTNTSSNSNKNNTNAFISEADARTIAVQHAGVSYGGLFAECELKSKNGVYIYEVEFKQNGFEYEYKINPVTGEIISFEKEWDD